MNIHELKTYIRSGGILDIAIVDQICREYGVTSASELAKLLVQKGHLTRWQADQLLEGKSTALGKYQLFDLIDRGGMGVVYKATQPSLNRTVAIKMILDSYRDQGESHLAGCAV